MAKRKSRPVASDSRLFVLALGLLVGFVTTFVLLLSRLPVDSVISQYNDDATFGAEVEEMNFDYYAVLQAQKAARKPEPEVIVVEPPVVFMEPPTTLAPEIVQRPVAPAVIPRAVPAPRVEQPRVQPRTEQPRIEQPSVQPRVQVPPIDRTPQRQPRYEAPARRSAPVREIMASDSGNDSFYVEAGNYRENSDAVRIQSALRGLGIESFIVVRQDSGGSYGHRVRIGPFLEQSRLDATRARLRATGLIPRLIRVKG